MAGGAFLGFSLAQVMVQEGIHAVGEGSGLGSQEFGIEPEETSSFGDRGRVARDDAPKWENLTLPVDFLGQLEMVIDKVVAEMKGVEKKIDFFGNSEQVRIYISCFLDKIFIFLCFFRCGRIRLRILEPCCRRTR